MKCTTISSTKNTFMLKDKVIEIFVPADDFCIEFKKHIDQFRLQAGR
jgi:hypothetical protein